MTAFRRAQALFLTLAATAMGITALATPALAAASLSIALDTGAETSITTARYSCAGGAPFAVQYINAGENNLALVPVDGVERVFVLTVSASGARYVSGAHEWWSKGDDATLDDTMTDAPAAECSAATE